MWKLLEGFNNRLGKVEGVVLSVFLTTMIVLAFFQVVMRNIFNSGIPWADTVVRSLVLWVGFLGASLATNLDRHLTLEVVTKYLSPRARHLTSVVVKLFAGVICYILFRASLHFLGTERSAREEFLGLFPAWISLSIIPVTFVLIPFHLLMSVIRDITAFVKGKTS